MNWIRLLRSKATLTQSALAAAGGTSQPTIAAYETGHKSPTLSTLERLAKSAGFVACVEYHRPLTREERRSLELHRAIAARLREQPTRVLAQAKANLGRMIDRLGEPSQPLREWAVLLDRPVDELVPLLTDLEPWARELRHQTPFAGVLSSEERAAVFASFRAKDKDAA